jgi:hypothetical protein
MSFYPLAWPPATSPIDDGVIYLGDPTGISAYADQQTDAANTFLLQLGTLAANLTAPLIEPVFPAGPDAPALESPTAPTLQTVVWTAPDAPPVFTETLDVTDVMPEPFDDSPPTLVFGTAPTFDEAAPDAPDIDTSYTMPTLSVSLPAAPDLLSISVTPFDGLNIPTVDFTVPDFTVEAPSIREYVPGAQYTSSLLTALKASLEDRITNGGTGLNQDVENAIWDRGREREARSRAEALRGLDKMEEQGFALPSGVYLDARLRIETESDYVNRGVSREIMIQSAELEQKNVLAALSEANLLEGKSMEYSNQVEQRLFDSCKYATEAGISIYNARVQAYSAFVDAYKAKVAIYEAQVRAEGLRVDAYKAQIDAEMAKASINRVLVDSYKVQADIALSNIEIFKAEIGAIQAKADIERNKIMIFGEQIKAYATRVQAYTAGVEGFRASIMAEGTKQDAYKSAVEAYSARVGAAAKVIEARIAAFRGDLDANVARWEGYKAAYQGEASRAQAISAYNQSLSEEYKAEAAATSSFNDNLTKQWQVALDQAQRVSEIGVQSAKANAELYITTRSLALDAAKVGAQVSAQLGAAALNAINWSSSTSRSESLSEGLSVSLSQSQSDSTSTNTNYNYSASV